MTSQKFFVIAHGPDGPWDAEDNTDIPPTFNLNEAFLFSEDECNRRDLWNWLQETKSPLILQEVRVAAVTLFKPETS